MGFLDDLRAISEQERCKVGRWLDTLATEYREEVEQAIVERFPSKTMWRVIVNRDGIVFSESVFARHVKGECSCGIQR